jgi:hypothetical protein
MKGTTCTDLIHRARVVVGSARAGVLLSSAAEALTCSGIYFPPKGAVNALPAKEGGLGSRGEFRDRHGAERDRPGGPLGAVAPRLAGAQSGLVQ